MSLPYRQHHQLHRIETRLLRSDPRLARMLGMFGRLSAGQVMPSWEQMSPSKEGVRQAAALLAEAVTILAAGLRVLLSAALDFAIAVTRGDRALLRSRIWLRGRTWLHSTAAQPRSLRKE